MGQTQHFGFYTFGSEGRLSDLGYKFTIQDRQTMDQLLYMLYNHDHSVLEPITGPAQRPNVEVAEDVAGFLSSGTLFYYQVSFVDVYGNETAASTVASVATLPPIATPPAPGLLTASTGGSLLGGTYRYAVAYRQGANTTLATNSGQINVPITTTTNTVTLSLGALPTGADSFDVYRRGPGDETYWLIANTAATTFLDNGSHPPDCTKTRPVRNTTNASSAIRITLSDEDIPVPTGVAAWRLYRSTGASFGGNSLLATVSTTVSENSAVLVTEYVDTGSGTLPGTPLSQSSIPPRVPSLNAATAFDLDGGAIPASLSPRGVSVMNLLLPGTLDALVYSRFVPTVDMHVGRVDAFALVAPTGLNATDKLTLRFKDTTVQNEVQSIWHNATPQNEIQMFHINGATAGTFTITFSAQTTAAIPWNATATQVQNALEALSNIQTVFVYGDGSLISPFYVEFIDPGEQNVALMTADAGSLTGVASIAFSEHVAGSDGGTFTLWDGSQTTAAISGGATAAALKAALELLTSIVEVSVTGSGTNSDPWLVEFINPSSTDIELLEPNDSGMNGSVFVSEVTEGRGNTVIDVVMDQAVQQFEWVGPSTLYGIVEAEEQETTGSVESNNLAANGFVAELNVLGETSTWHVGLLDAGSYEFTYSVAHRASDVEFDVVVWTYGDSGSWGDSGEESGDPPYFEAYRRSVPVSNNVGFVNRIARVVLTEASYVALQVEKTDAEVGAVHVDRYQFEARLPVLAAGSDCSVEILVGGVPTTNGQNLQVAAWY